jgi:hypothetical protein
LVNSNGPDDDPRSPPVAMTDGGHCEPGTEHCPPLRENLKGEEWAAGHEMEVVRPWEHNPDEKILERCQREGCDARRVVDKQANLRRWSA